ncbi:MAG: DUF2752 domain-containing protein [Ruminococcaceae bacterium]|nr:DUF2752 domain-containing protein [Oscillospiraceae bacterium]
MLSSKQKKILVLLLDFVFLALCFSARWLSQLMIDELNGCKLYEIFGIKCLTCGGTRCVNAMFSGNLKDAFSYNAFVPIAFVLAIFALFLCNAAWVFQKEKAKEIIFRLCNLKLLTVIVIITAGYMFGRNVLEIAF